MLAADEGFALDDFDTTVEIAIPDDPLKRVVGQDEAVALARIAANQRRHFLLVGPPGTGKSMIAQALSLHLPSVTEEIRVVHNPENPERPFVEVKQRDDVLTDQSRLAGAEGDLIDPKEAPINVAERLGYKCVHCGTYSFRRPPGGHLRGDVRATRRARPRHHDAAAIREGRGRRVRASGRHDSSPRPEGAREAPRGREGEPAEGARPDYAASVRPRDGRERDGAAR